MGKVVVVGIGPGNYENMTVGADQALQKADVIVGYHVYVDLIKERYPEKEFITTPMTQETKRCRMASMPPGWAKPSPWSAPVTAASMEWPRDI